MSARTLLWALVISTIAVAVTTALLYRTAAGGGLALVGALVLLVVAGGVAWASGARRAQR